jgi:hypothetical protein
MIEMGIKVSDSILIPSLSKNLKFSVAVLIMDSLLVIPENQY